MTDHSRRGWFIKLIETIAPVPETTPEAEPATPPTDANTGINRRIFLKNGAVATAAVTSPGTAAALVSSLIPAGANLALLNSLDRQLQALNQAESVAMLVLQSTQSVLIDGPEMREKLERTFGFYPTFLPALRKSPAWAMLGREKTKEGLAAMQQEFASTVQNIYSKSIAARHKIYDELCSKELLNAECPTELETIGDFLQDVKKFPVIQYGIPGTKMPKHIKDVLNDIRAYTESFSDGTLGQWAAHHSTGLDIATDAVEKVALADKAERDAGPNYKPKKNRVAVEDVHTLLNHPRIKIDYYNDRGPRAAYAYVSLKKAPDDDISAQEYLSLLARKIEQAFPDTFVRTAFNEKWQDGSVADQVNITHPPRALAELLKAKVSKEVGEKLKMLEEIPQRNRDSFLALLLRWKNDRRQLPETLVNDMAQRLAVQDIVMPDMRRTVQFAELLDDGLRHPGVVKEIGEPRLILHHLWSDGEIRPRNLGLRYQELTSEEKGYAMEYFAPDAHVVTTESEPALYKHFQDIFSKAEIAPERRPHIIRINSDIPQAMFTVKAPGRPHGAVLFASNLQEILTNKQFDKIILHEVGHYKKRDGEKFGWAKRLLEMATLNYPRRREEHLADGFAAKYESPDDMVGALMRYKMRKQETSSFKKQLGSLLEEFGIDLYTKPKNSLAQFLDKHRLREAHPPFPKRFDHIYNVSR